MKFYHPWLFGVGVTMMDIRGMRVSMFQGWMGMKVGMTRIFPPQAPGFSRGDKVGGFGLNYSNSVL